MSFPDAQDFTTLRRQSPTGSATCEYAWCTTAHGATIHPDDEDHRSAGILIPAVVRDGDSAVHETEIEVGLLHRVHDTHTWLVIEDGAEVHLELRLDAARSVAQALRDDPRLSSALGLTTG